MKQATTEQKIEFATAFKKVATISAMPLYKRFTKREDRRKILCEAVDALSDTTIVVFHEEIIRMIDMTEEVCSMYESAEEQYKGILEWMPRIDIFKPQVMESIKEKRNKYGMEV